MINIIMNRKENESLNKNIQVDKGLKCKNKKRNINDIRGKRFNMLLAMYPVGTKKGQGTIWHCRCDCGNEIDVPYNNFAYGNMVSCGCQKKKHDKELNKLLTHIDGTSIDAIRSRKTPSNNTTGCRGVYKIRDKYVAKIVFKKKQYSLGTYDNINDAVEARKRAESVLFDRIVDYYNSWKVKADKDKVWAENNPIHFEISKDESGTFNINILPILT